MKRFVVIPLSCSGKGNRVFKNGDIVFENNFPEGSIPSLIAEGWLKPIDDELEVDEQTISTENPDHTEKSSEETAATTTEEKSETGVEEPTEEPKAENLDETVNSETTETVNAEVVNEENQNAEATMSSDVPEGGEPLKEATDVELGDGVKEVTEETTTDNANAEATAKTEDIKAFEKTFDEWKVVDMRTKLRELNVKFDPAANKEELFELLKKA